MFPTLVRELSLEDTQSFYYYHRMCKAQFNELLEMIEPLIAKQDTKLRKAVTAKERLSVTLRHLATGKSKQSLSKLIGLGLFDLKYILFLK